MKSKSLLILILSVVLFDCSPAYETTTAKITALEQSDNFEENGIFIATIEYTVSGKTYVDSFELPMMRMVEDSIAMPHPGTTFDIQYNPANPEENKIIFQVK